jgi:Uma2 family endonuclease
MAEPVPQLARMTFADAAQLDPDDAPGELIDGEWTPVTKSTYRHGRILLRAGKVLSLYEEQNPEWVAVGGDPGTKLTRNPDTLRGPDLALVRSERLPEGKGEEGWLEGSPEVVLEILGDSQSISQLMRKALEYLRAGAQLVLLLDGDAREVVVVRPPDHFSVLKSDQTITGGDLLPGFSCPVSQLFP